MKTSKYLDTLLYLWWIAFFISMACCFRAVSSISIALILATGLLKNKIETGSWLNMNLKNSFFLASCLFYLLQATGLLFTSSLTEASRHLQLKSAMVLVPLTLCCGNYLDVHVRQKLMRWYIYILAAVMLFCLLVALHKYFFLHAQNDVFFYHELVRPFNQHAVQLSIFLFAGLVYLLERARKAIYLHNRTIHFLLVVYFTCCILLLSSKLVIAFSGICFAYYIMLALRTKLDKRFIIFTSLFAGLALILLVLLTQNKISTRFKEIYSGDMSLASRQRFDPAIYFNGLQFRLLEGRFVKEILTERHAWLTGVSDEAQPLLDKKYVDAHMYIGDGLTPDRGYLGYNTHNQFLESVLRSGIPGLLVFILICCTLVSLAARKKNRELTIITILLIAYCFNESVFETQYGITLFTFFPLFLYYGTTGRNKTTLSPGS
ncbi:MAG: hypothetical protein ABI741_01215 [Ferruginibacter sp.]